MSRLIGFCLLAAVTVAGCRDDGRAGSPPPASVERIVRISGLEFAIPPDWRVLEVVGMLSSQESLAGLMGTVPLRDPCHPETEAPGCRGVPYDLTKGGIGVVITRDGNFGLRVLPTDPGYVPSEDLNGLPGVRRILSTPDPRTHAEQTLEWTIKPPHGDLIRITAQIAGDAGQRAVVERVVASVRVVVDRGQA